MNSNFVDIYRPIAILMVAAIGFAISPLAMAWLWSKKFSLRKPGPVKNSTYECGLESKNDVFLRFRPEYYLYAIVFLIFDVELVFLFPWAVVAKKTGWMALVEIVIFFFILFMGFLYAHKKGALKWM